MKKLITDKQIKEGNNLREYILKNYNIDVISRTREGLYPAYRTLFNTILFRKYKFTKSQIAYYYRAVGWESKSHATVLCSLGNFKRYKEEYPEIYKAFIELYPPAKQAKKKREFLKYKLENQNDLQKIVSTIPKEKHQEIIELINLRVKSWEWKNKDNVKIYTGAFA